MIELIKLFFKVIVSLVFGFGFWYLILWFITAEPNLFIWTMWTKIFYIFFGGIATEAIAKILNEYE
jgi:multisubunit Na+/H+ antiporter MnhE subunit